MTEFQKNKNDQAIYKLVADMFQISAMYYAPDATILNLIPMYEKEKSLRILKDRMHLAGYTYSLDDSGDQIILKVNAQPTFKIPPLNILLFFLTLLSIYIVPVFIQEYSSLPLQEIIHNTYLALMSGRNITFTFAMISILLVHEMGHYIASRRRNIITSWPYFIPAPNIIGTFGAIIKSKSPFWNRRDLIEVGAWGPIAGWIVALAWTIYGILTAHVEPISAQMETGFLGEPLIFKFLTSILIHVDSENYAVMLNEAIFAGWVGMLVTAINMLPIGQLDGGHIVYGVIKKKQHIVAMFAMGVLIVLGFESPLWWVFAFMGVVFGLKHPPTLNDSLKPSRNAMLLAISALVILILSFTPMPFH